MAQTFTAYVERDPDSGIYVGIIPSLRGAHSQGPTLDELLANLRDVVALCLEEAASRGEAVPEEHFVGLLRVAVVA